MTSHANAHLLTPGAIVVPQTLGGPVPRAASSQRRQQILQRTLQRKGRMVMIMGVTMTLRTAMTMTLHSRLQQGSMLAVSGLTRSD